MGTRTATELAEELERRRRDDPDYRAEVERVEREHAERAESLRVAEQPVVTDLRDLGIDIESVWDLHRVEESRPLAIPVLLDHLTRDYPDNVLEGIGQGLDHPSARDRWDDLRALLLTTDRDVVRDRLAAAMSGIAVRAHYDDLLSFLEDENLGDSRIFFLRPTHRIGNRMDSGQGRAVIADLVDDPVLGTEAGRILAGRSRNS